MFEIEQNIVEQVRGYCPHMMICLSGDFTLYGKVKEISKSFLIVESYPEHQCADCRHSFKLEDKVTPEEAFVCSCPVRKEIYRKYGKQPDLLYFSAYYHPSTMDIMFEIGQEIINQVREHCQKWKGCLSGDMSLCCKVKEGGIDYLIMEPPPHHNPPNCPYSYKVKDKDSDVYYCACPVRKEIYRKYWKQPDSFLQITIKKAEPLIKMTLLYRDEPLTKVYVALKLPFFSFGVRLFL